MGAAAARAIEGTSRTPATSPAAAADRAARRSGDLVSLTRASEVRSGSDRWISDPSNVHPGTDERMSQVTLPPPADINNDQLMIRLCGRVRERVSATRRKPAPARSPAAP